MGRRILPPGGLGGPAPFAAAWAYDPPVESLEPLLFLLRRYAERVALELRAAGFVAEKLALTLLLAAAWIRTEAPVVLPRLDRRGLVLGSLGLSLLLVEQGMAGFSKGKRLKKLGMKAQDTSELFFNDVQVPVDNLLGGPAMEGRGFICLMEQLPWERLQIAITAVAAAQAAIDWTLDYVKQRKVFGQSVASFQNTRHTLAELQTQVQVARVFVDKCCELIVRDQLDTETASMAKYWTTDLQCKVMDECVQLFGGYGYMWEYPITRAYADARVQRIYGGTNEIMKEVIARAMGLGK